MKTIFLFFIISVVLSCLGTDTFAIELTDWQTAQLEKAKTYKTGDTLGIVIKDITTSIAYKDTVGFDSDTFYKNTGKHAAIVMVWLLNLTDNTLKVNPEHFKAITNNGFTLPINKYTYKTIDPFQNTRLQSNTETQGFIVFGLNTSDAAGRIKKIIYDDQNGNRIARSYDDAVLYGLYDHIKKREK